jgi:hypothetical protein
MLHYMLGSRSLYAPLKDHKIGTTKNLTSIKHKININNFFVDKDMQSKHIVDILSVGFNLKYKYVINKAGIMERTSNI